MVGDWAERDVVGAKSLGMTTVFARYGDTFDTRESGADFDIQDVFELVAIVDRLNAGSEAGPRAPAPRVKRAARAVRAVRGRGRQTPTRR